MPGSPPPASTSTSRPRRSSSSRSADAATPGRATCSSRPPATPRSPTAALRAIVGGFSRWHAEHHQLGRIVQFEFRHLSPEHRAEVIDLRKDIDNVVADVLRDGVATGELDVDDVPATALALLSMAIDVARWYVPGGRRTPEAIEQTYGDLAVRLASGSRDH